MSKYTLCLKHMKTQRMYWHLRTVTLISDNNKLACKHTKNNRPTCCKILLARLIYISHKHSLYLPKTYLIQRTRETTKTSKGYYGINVRYFTKSFWCYFKHFQNYVVRIKLKKNILNLKNKVLSNIYNIEAIFYS